MPDDDPICGQCGARKSAHSGKVCDACNSPVEHHATMAEEIECWEGRARMAVTRRDAGVELTRVDRDALRRCPDPPFLTVNGYQPKETP